MKRKSGRSLWCVTLLATAAACSGVHTVRSLDGIAIDTRVRVDGTLSMRGSTPLTFMVLEVPDADEITLKGHDVDIETQLKSLDGMHVLIEGAVMPRLDPAVPRLDVLHCELVAPPGGGNPVYGAISMENDACVLTTDAGKRYWLVGDLAPALAQHAGARVWIVGKKARHADGTRPRESTAFTPTGYGVME
jgi:hypothetical protein